MNTERADEADLMPACPTCGYLLRGLSVAHRCPECGLAFDRRWRLYGGRSKSRGPAAWLASGRIVLLIPFAWLVIAGLLIPFATMPRHLRLLSLLVVGGAAALHLYLALYRPRKFVALGPEGLVVCRGRNHLEIYAWPQVRKARNDMLRKCLTFDYADRVVRVKAFPFFAGDVLEIDRCASAINNYPRERGC